MDPIMPVAAPVCLIQAAEEDAEIMSLESEREKVKERCERLGKMEELDEERELKRTRNECVLWGGCDAGGILCCSSGVEFCFERVMCASACIPIAFEV